MLPREGLSDRTFSVLAEIRHPNNSTKLADINSVRLGLHRRRDRQKERKLYLDGTVLQATFTIQTETENNLVVRHSEYSESNLE